MWASVSKHLQYLSLFPRALNLGFGPQVRRTQEGRILSSGIQQSLASKVRGGGSIPTGPFLSRGSDHPQYLEAPGASSLRLGLTRPSRSIQSAQLERTGKKRGVTAKITGKKEARGETDRNRQTEGGARRSGRRAQASKPSFPPRHTRPRTSSPPTH